MGMGSCRADAPSNVGGPLFERDAEVQQILGAVASLNDGRASVLAAIGEAGIGKSTLLDVLGAAATAAGCVVARTTGSELRAPLAYVCARELITPLVAAAGGAKSLGIAQRPRMDVALKVLDEQEIDQGQRGSMFGESARIMAFGLAECVQEVAATSPVVLLADDLQWVDEPTQRWLAFLAHRLRNAPVLIAVGVREGDPRDATPSVAALTHPEDVTVLRPRRLTEHGTAALMRSALGGDVPAALAHECHELANGNPFLTLELVERLGSRSRTASERMLALEEARLDSFTDEAHARASAMHEDCVAVAEALSTLGANARVDDIAALADLDLDETAARIADLERARLIDASDRSFVHPILRLAFADGMGRRRRAALHELAAVRSHQRGEPASGIAAHLQAIRPGRLPWARAVLAAAASADLERGAPETAIRHLRRALGEPDGTAAADAELEAMLGQCYWQCRLIDQASDAFARSAEATVDPDLRLLRVIQRAIVLANSGPRVADALRVLKAATTDAGESVSREVELFARAGILGLELNVDPLAIGPDVDAQAALPGASRGERSMLMMLAWRAFLRGDERRVVVELGRRGLDDGEPPIEAFIAPAAIPYALFALLLAEDVGFVSELLDRFEPRVRALNGLHGTGTLLAARAGLQLWVGAPRAATASAEEALDLIGAPATTGTLALAYHLEALVELGENERARAVHDAAADAAEGVPTFNRSGVLRARGLIEEAEGRLEDALATFREVGHLDTTIGLPLNPWGPWRIDAARVARALDDDPQSMALTREHLALARVWGAPRALASALAACVPAGVDVATDAAVNEGLSPVQRSDVLRDLGLGDLRAGRKVAARERLRAALQMLTPEEHVRRAQAIEAALRTAGGRRRRADTDPLGLTAAQRRLAELAAHGHTNREIAELLVITPKSVENQLGRIYRKLGIGSRDDLRAALQPES